ncbi:MAG: sensor histidine kinase [Labedaea sp.]
MNLDDRLRDTGQALVIACTNGDDADRGAQLLRVAYERLQSGLTMPADAPSDDHETTYSMGMVCETQGDLHGAALCFQQAAANDFEDAADRLTAVLARLDLRSTSPAREQASIDNFEAMTDSRSGDYQRLSDDADDSTISENGPDQHLTEPAVGQAIHHAVQRLSATASELHNGLTESAAAKATRNLVKALNCVAIGITDSSGRLLFWDGGANEHHKDLTEAIDVAVRSGRRAHVDHTNLTCSRRRRCPMRTAVIVPLIIDGDVEGTLIVVGKVNKKRLFRATDEVAQFVRIQLKLTKLEESKQRQARAERRMLRAQISPHFPYNALNTISSLIRTDPEQARDLLQEFADFTRYSFRSSGLFTTLADELRNVDRYLTIQSVRYQERLNVRIKIAPEVLSVVVPFLVLQPLVENAVRHGISPKPGGGTVTVIAQDDGNEALISVEDDGVGMDPDRLFADLRDAHKTGAYVGLGNINQRMRSVFGDEYALMVETAPGAGMKVILRVPKFFPGIRPDLPVLSSSADEGGDESIPAPARTDELVPGTAASQSWGLGDT